ncbi:MAG: hypothetical protein RJA75_695 [Actinomycetota bacterium]|jgi:uncharacterized membrane protein YheB (UPF0754 family)
MVAKPEAHAVSDLLKMRDPKQSSVGYFLEVPAFQRGLVWSDEKKRNLIASMYKGFPIGSLLLYASKEIASDGKRVNAQIIDGLQRSTAILDYAAKPLKFAPVADHLISADTKATILRILQDSGSKIEAKQVRDAINQWAIETEEPKLAKGFKTEKLISKLTKAADANLEEDIKDELSLIIDGEVIDYLNEQFKVINNYKVPVIVYSGSEEDLPEIFESLNSGTPLTKYDKFGATWSTHTVKTKTEEIRTAIKERYSVYIDKGWEVQDFDVTQDLGEDDLNLFEYLTGLGKVLSDKYASLFDQMNKNSEPSSSAFVLTTVAHGLKIADMASLPKQLNSGGVIDLSAFEEALMKACFLVNGKLAELLALKMNQRNANDRFLPHSENQILSIILRVLIEQFDTNTWKPLKEKTQLNSLLDNIQVHYVRDILGEAWRGSGDSTLFERVWIKNESTGSLSRSPFYLQRPTEADINQLLVGHHEAELNKRQSNRGNLSAKSKLLLRVLYTDIISHKDNVTIQFDIEHLAPVKALSNLISNKKIDDGLPISCLGNLAVLPTILNIIKGKHFVGDHMNEKPADYTEDKVSKINTYVIQPKAKDITQSLVKDEAEYLDFVKSRFLEQKKHILKNLGY